MAWRSKTSGRASTLHDYQFLFCIFADGDDDDEEEDEDGKNEYDYDDDDDDHDDKEEEEDRMKMREHVNMMMASGRPLADAGRYGKRHDQYIYIYYNVVYEYILYIFNTYCIIFHVIYCYNLIYYILSYV